LNELKNKNKIIFFKENKGIRKTLWSRGEQKKSTNQKEIIKKTEP
jgi:hypothetical protein